MILEGITAVFLIVKVYKYKKKMKFNSITEELEYKENLYKEMTGEKTSEEIESLINELIIKLEREPSITESIIGEEQLKLNQSNPEINFQEIINEVSGRMERKQYFLKAKAKDATTSMIENIILIGLILTVAYFHI